MKREFIFEWRQTAGQMEAVMLLASGVALVAAILAFLGYGLVLGAGFFVLSLIAYALSRLFDLMDGLFASICYPEKETKPQPAKKVQS